MTSSERIKRALSHKEPDRVPIQDSPWGSTVERWKKEGLPVGVSPDDYFGFEMTSVGFDSSPRFPVKTLKKTERYIVYATSTGAINKDFWDHSSTPELVDRPIKTKEDWEKKIKPRLYPDYTRVDWVSTFNNYNRARSEGKFISFGGGWDYDILQGYIRSEHLLMAMADDPDFVKDMVMTLAKLHLKMYKMMMDKGIKPDGIFCSNDLGYRNGLLFSPETYRRTHKEADEMIWSFAHKNDMFTLLHSCGCVKELIPDLIEGGLDCLQPLEVKAGMDLIELKGKYGLRLSFMGGIDVRAMAEPDPGVIEEEISKKFKVAKKGGGYIYHSDHSVPHNVSFQQFTHVIELVKRYGKY